MLEDKSDPARKPSRIVGLHKPVVVGALLLAAVALTYVAHDRFSVSTIFTHTFYIPIILAALWWKRRGIWVAVGLGLILIASHATFLRAADLGEDVLRATVFIAVSALVALLSERLARHETALLDYQARLRRLAADLSMAEERLRGQIASELHDRIGRNLTAARLKVALLQQSPGANPAGALKEISDLLGQTIDDTQALTFEIHPPLLYEMGLAPAVRWLVDEFQERHGIACRFTGQDGIPAMSDETRGLVFSAVRELLFNVAKHAKAGHVEVSLRVQGSNLAATVADDGVGFDPAALSGPRKGAGGFGLFSIRERLGCLGGTVEIQSQPQRGSRVTLIVPVAESSPQPGDPHGDSNPSG